MIFKLTCVSGRQRSQVAGKYVVAEAVGMGDDPISPDSGNFSACFSPAGSYSEDLKPSMSMLGGFSEEHKCSSLTLGNSSEDHKKSSVSNHRRKQTIRLLEDWEGNENVDSSIPLIESEVMFCDFVNVVDEQIVTSEETATLYPAVETEDIWCEDAMKVEQQDVTQEEQEAAVRCLYDDSEQEEKRELSEEIVKEYHSPPEPMLEEEVVADEPETGILFHSPTKPQLEVEEKQDIRTFLAESGLDYNSSPEPLMEVQAVAEDVAKHCNAVEAGGTYADLSTMVLLQEQEPCDQSHFVRRSLRKRSVRLEEPVDFQSEDDDESPPRRKNRSKARRQRRDAYDFESEDEEQPSPQRKSRSRARRQRRAAKDTVSVPQLELQSAEQPPPLKPEQNPPPAVEQQQRWETHAPPDQPRLPPLSTELRETLLRTWEEFMVQYVGMLPKQSLRVLDEGFRQRMEGNLPPIRREPGWLEHLIGTEKIKKIFVNLGEDTNKESS